MSSKNRYTVDNIFISIYVVFHFPLKIIHSLLLLVVEREPASENVSIVIMINNNKL